MWGSLVGGLVSNIANNFIDFGFGEWSASNAYKRAKKLMQHQIRWRVQDMKAAGLNPLLSVSGGVHGGATSFPMGATGRSDIAGSAKNVALARSAAELVDGAVREQNAKAVSAESEAARAPERVEKEIELLNAENVAKTGMGHAAMTQGKLNQLSADVVRNEAIKKRYENAIMSMSVPNARVVADWEKTPMAAKVNLVRHVLSKFLPGGGASLIQAAGMAATKGRVK